MQAEQSITLKINLYKMIRCLPVLLSALCVGNNLSLFAQSDSLVIPLWKNGAPGYESKKDVPE